MDTFVNTLKFFPRNSHLFRVLLIIKTSFDSICNSSLVPTEAVSLGRDLFLKDVQNESKPARIRACLLSLSFTLFFKKSGFLITETRRKQHFTLILRLKLTVSTYRMNEINFASSFMDAMNALCYVLKNFTFNVIYILLTCHCLVSRMRVVIQA